MIFEWDTAKAEENLAKHGVSFAEAEIAFGDLYAAEELDEGHSTVDEMRFKMLAMSNERVLVVVYTMRGENYRIISAREAESYERRFYERQRAEDFPEH
jgi:uncharacterized protein